MKKNMANLCQLKWLQYKKQNEHHDREDLRRELFLKRIKKLVDEEMNQSRHIKKEDSRVEARKSFGYAAESNGYEGIAHAKPNTFALEKNFPNQNEETLHFNNFVTVFPSETQEPIQGTNFAELREIPLFDNDSSDTQMIYFQELYPHVDDVTETQVITFDEFFPPVAENNEEEWINFLEPDEDVSPVEVQHQENDINLMCREFIKQFSSELAEFAEIQDTTDIQL